MAYLARCLVRSCNVKPFTSHRYSQARGRATATQAKGHKNKAAAPRHPKGKKRRPMSLTVAVNGCGHGELDTIYATIQDIEQQRGKPVDLLISCGDFQAMRNVDDLHCFAAPPKYRAMMDFHQYYSGEKKAPVPTLFVGGNHEAANHLWELYYGGWAAPNIMYMGAAGVVNFGGARIAGLTGIYKPHDYTCGHFEMPPYDNRTVRSAYHVRDLEVYRLMKLREKVDVMVSHDWPTSIPRYGNLTKLLRDKPYFKQEVEKDELGSPANWQLLQAMKPRYWFAGHLHVHFAAVVPHSASKNEPGAGSALPPLQGDADSVTRFLSVDKPIPRRRFVQIVDIPIEKPAPKEFTYDEEWLAVLRETHGMLEMSRRPTRFPTPFNAAPEVAQEHRNAVAQSLRDHGGPQIPKDGFVQTVDPKKRGQGQPPRSIPRNPQTEHVLKLIGRGWNLGGGTNDRELGAQGRVTLDDLFAAAGDAAAANGGNDSDAVEDDGGDDSGMFEKVDIHNMDPHAISDAKIQDERAAAVKAAGAAAAAAAAVGLMPESVKRKVDPVSQQSVGAVAQNKRGVENPEELDIGDDWDDGG